MIDTTMSANMEMMALHNAQSSPFTKNTGNVTGSKQAEKTAEDFEAFFVSQSLAQMYKGIETDGLFGGGHAEKVFRSMMVDEYGRMIAQNGGIGISDEISKAMLQMQENLS